MDNFRLINYGRIKKNAYLINEDGDIYSTLSKKQIAFKFDKDGYKAATFQSDDGKRVTYRIASLVLTAFVGPPPSTMKDPTVNHKDSDIINNNYLNLEWMERGLNSSIRVLKPTGELNGSSVLTNKEVIEICDLLADKKLRLKDIANIYNVDISIISSIKRKKTWKDITKGYNFSVNIQRNKMESEKQRNEIMSYIKQNIKPSEIVKMGYSKSVVYRCYNSTKLMC